MTSSPMRPMRPTGYLERYFISQNFVNFYTKVQVTASYNIPKSLIPDWDDHGLERVIYTALAETINQQPIMGVTVADYGSLKPRWRRLDKIDLREVVKVITADITPETWIQGEQRVGFEKVQELPLWRIVVAKGPETVGVQDVIFNLGGFFFHAIADGMSTAAFHLTFLEAINKLVEGKIKVASGTLQDAAIVLVSDQALLPTLEMKAHFRTGLTFIIKSLFKAFIYDPPNPQHWSGPVVNDSPNPPVQNHHIFSLPSATAINLVSRCRLENTTITALVVALIAQRIAVMYPNYSCFSCSVPCSLRKFTGHGPRDMGCYVSGMHLDFSSQALPSHRYIPCWSLRYDDTKVDDQQLWNSARECKFRIQKAASTIRNHHVSLLKYVPNLPKYYFNMVGKKREYSFEVTNIGVLDGGIGEDGVPVCKASFDKAIFTGNVSKFSGPFCFSICTVKNGYMTVSLGWEKEVVSDESAVELGEWLKGCLDTLGSETSG